MNNYEKAWVIRKQQEAERQRTIQYLLTFGLLPGVWPEEDQTKIKFRRVTKQEKRNGNL